jgi:hypothetical protein
LTGKIKIQFAFNATVTLLAFTLVGSQKPGAGILQTALILVTLSGRQTPRLMALFVRAQVARRDLIPRVSLFEDLQRGMTRSCSQLCGQYHYCNHPKI